MVKIPAIKFNNGRSMPILGLGTWQAKEGELERVISDAIDIGYRHIDCAYVYGNEKEIGQAIKQKIASGAVKREDLFITSKLWNTYHRPDLVEKAVRRSLSDLELEYLDLYLIHWPTAYKEGDEIAPKSADGEVIFSDVDYVDTWKAMEALVEKGLTKSIGVSNFNSKQIERVLNSAKILPVTNQVECHPYLAQQKLLEFCKARNISLTAYSPLGSPARPWAKADDPNLLDDAKIKDIANKYNKTPVKVLLRFAIDRGVAVIPKSANKTRLADNFDLWDFKLAPEDVSVINSLDRNIRFVPQVDGQRHKDHPFLNVEF